MNCLSLYFIGHITGNRSFNDQKFARKHYQRKILILNNWRHWNDKVVQKLKFLQLRIKNLYSNVLASIFSFWQNNMISILSQGKKYHFSWKKSSCACFHISVSLVTVYWHFWSYRDLLPFICFIEPLLPPRHDMLQKS